MIPRVILLQSKTLAQKAEGSIHSFKDFKAIIVNTIEVPDRVTAACRCPTCIEKCQTVTFVPGLYCVLSW